MKSKIINQLLGAVFGLDADFGRLFKNKIWNRTVSGRSTVRSMCQNIEQTRKAHGGEFNPKSRSKRSRYSSENDVLIEKSVKYTDFFLLSIVYV